MYMFNTCSIFCHEICAGVLGITLIVTNTKYFFTSCPPLQGSILGYSGAYFGILCLLFETRSICSHVVLYRCSWCSFRGSLHHFFHIMTLFLDSFFGIFLYNFRTNQYFLMKLSAGVLHIMLMVTTLKEGICYVLHSWGPFFGYFWTHFGISFSIS